MKTSTTDSPLPYFDGSTFSELYANDVKDGNYVFMLSYPTTSIWSSYPNTLKFFLQDGNQEENKVGYDKIRQKEPWKNLAVLGDSIKGILSDLPSISLVNYWQKTFDFSMDHAYEMCLDSYCYDINENAKIDKVITLFPYDHILPEKHAVNPEKHYFLLSKTTLGQMSSHVPSYQTFKCNIQEITKLWSLRRPFPFLIKTSHGLSGEGTYIIRNQRDLEHCRREVEAYMRIHLLEEVILSDFVHDQRENYCVQFYIDKQGGIQLLGFTQQLVSEKGEFQGGVIDYKADMSKFTPIIKEIAAFANWHGYFGVIGVDILEDKAGKLHVIDANIRVNGSTPLCLQRKRLMAKNKFVAKYATEYWFDGSLSTVFHKFEEELKNEDFILLSTAQQTFNNHPYTDIYGIVTGHDLEEMIENEQKLISKGLIIR